MDADTYKYWGFISYSHQDRRWGEWLHRALESYRVPARLIGREGLHGTIPKRLFPIFRDRAELPTAGGLDVELARALEASRCFILICSPAAAGSRWVNEEVLRFKQLGRESRILCLIVDGEPNATAAGRPEQECFPPALRYLLGADGQLSNAPAEPLAADLRPGADGRDNARLKIVAGLLGIGFDEIKRRDLQARNRRLGILAAISTGVAALTIVLAVQAVLARRAAEHSRQQGEDLIGFMLGDLRGKLEPLGKLDILDAIGDKSMRYFDTLDNRNLSEAALTARAKALRQIGDVRFKQGRAADAAEAIEAALALNSDVAQRHPDDANLQFELGQTEFWVAFAAWRAKQLDRAEEHFEAYHQISQQLVERDPKNPKWQLELAYSENNLGMLAFGRNRYEPALDHFQRSAGLLEAIEPKDAEVHQVLANAYSWRGSSLQSLGRLREAIRTLQEQVATLRDLAAEQPDDMQRKLSLAQAFSALGFAAVWGNDPVQSRLASDEGLALAAALEQNDPANEDYHYLTAAHQYIRATGLALNGDMAEAERSVGRSRERLERLLARDPKRAEAATLLRASWQLGFDLALAQERFDAARSIVDESEALCSGASVDPVAQADLACARSAMRAWELASVVDHDISAAEAHHHDFESRLASSGQSGELVARPAIDARAKILAGHPAEAASQLKSLLAGGYLPPELFFFLQRHCSGELSRLTGVACTHAENSQ